MTKSSFLAVLALTSLALGGVGHAQTGQPEKSLNAQLIEFAKQGDEARARKVLEAGAVPDSRNRQGETALFMFSRRGSLPAVVMLLERGADPNLANLEKSTPLMAAADAGHAQIVRVLLDSGADPARVDQINKTALLYATRDLGPEETELRRADLAASYQRAIVRALVGGLRAAAEARGVERLAVVGGVAANSELRAALPDARFVPLALCTDNAAMIASCARFLEPIPSPRYLALDAYASLS